MRDEKVTEQRGGCGYQEHGKSKSNLLSVCTDVPQSSLRRIDWLETPVKVLITREAAHIHVVAHTTLASDDEKIPLISVLSHSIY